MFPNRTGRDENEPCMSDCGSEGQRLRLRGEGCDLLSASLRFGGLDDHDKATAVTGRVVVVCGDPLRLATANDASASVVVVVVP